MLLIPMVPFSAVSCFPKVGIFVRKSSSFSRNVIAGCLLSKEIASAVPKRASNWVDFATATLKFSPALSVFSWPLPTSAAEAEQLSSKINVESIVVGIDDFFNRNPFFMPGVIFVWLVVIPVTQEFLKKCKNISALDAFRKLRDVPQAQMLDIRRRESIRFMASPNLKILGKAATQVEFVENEEDEFVKQVLAKFTDPADTVLCILDNFDGNALKAAELLYKSGFKEAYAIKGGLRGNNGWEAIQAEYLPSSVHVFPKKKRRKEMRRLEVNGEEVMVQSNGGAAPQGAPGSMAPPETKTEDGNEMCAGSNATGDQLTGRHSSPYPNYPDLKPPSSPTPSNPVSNSGTLKSETDHVGAPAAEN